MCSIFGVVTKSMTPVTHLKVRIADMMEHATERGRDGMGVRITQLNEERDWSTLTKKTVLKVGSQEHNDLMRRVPEFCSTIGHLSLIGNARAEPTTEWVKHKVEHDQQPYSVGKWTIVHNGTIANDKNLRTGTYPSDVDSAAIVELLCEMEASLEPKTLEAYYDVFISTIQQLKGSFAILATHRDVPGFIFTACNYRPIWLGKTLQEMWFASQSNMLPHDAKQSMQEPYTCNLYDAHGSLDMRVSLFKEDVDKKPRALVVASGGMDSTVAAKLCQDQGMDVTLINFQYGCRAEDNELKAIKAIAENMGVPLVLFPIPIYDPTDSPLFDHTATIAGGEAGAEFAHEWVPARNLVMLSVATAYAEAKGFDFIVLGNNLEEAGAYPDNEPEFVNRFNEMLPFAVGDGKRVRVLMPVGNLMKHEIVAQGLAHAAPLHLTWSCYRNNEHHCGTCGPCMMRKTAFAINNAEEVIKYND